MTAADSPTPGTETCRAVPTSVDLPVDQGSECGREMPTDPPSVCGAPPVVWVAFDPAPPWDAHHVATACEAHSAELLAFPGIRVSSDAPMVEGDL